MMPRLSTMTRLPLLCLALLLFQPPGQEHPASGPRTARAHVSIFVTTDCPISNYYAPEIQHLCTEYAAKGLTCSLVYEDVAVDEAQMRVHLAEYGYRDVPASLDRDRSLARRAGATVTPQAVVTDATGRIRYRGRIDNRYQDFGRPRRVVTERSLRDAIDAVLAGHAVPTFETPALGCHIVFPSSGRKRP
jgi:hypothetical protein